MNETADAAFAACLAALDRGDPQAASLLQDLLRLYPGHAPGWETLGQRLHQKGKFEAALACFQRAAATAPSFGLAMARGQILRQLGRLREAQTAFDEACGLDPTSARACFFLGLCAQDGGDLRAAQTAYERALAIAPDLVEAGVNLGVVLQDLKDLSGAKRAYGRAMRRRPEAFGRISQALAAAPRGELWLDLEGLRRALAG